MSRRSTTAIIGASLLTGVTLGASGLASAATSGPSSTSTPPSGSTSNAPVRTDPDRPRPAGPFDLVSSVKDSTLRLDTPSGQQSVVLTSQTRYRLGPAPATRAALSPQDLVLVRFVDPTATSLVASSVEILPARAEGYVLRVSGTTLTVLDGSGFTRTVSTTSATTYRRAGAPTTFAAVTAHSYVRALGAVAGDGTTLTASSVQIGAPAQPGPRGPRH